MARPSPLKGVKPTIPLEQCARKIILQRFGEMWRLREGTIAGQDIECLHDMRVASRRLRAAMTDLAQCFPRKRFGKRLSEAKRLTEALGSVRDLDVMIDFYERYRQRLRPEEQPALDGLISFCRNLREERRARLLKLFDKLERKKFAARFQRLFRSRRDRL